MKRSVVNDRDGYTGPGYAWVILAMGTLCLFGAVGMGRFAYGMVLPAMQEGLGMNNTQAGALATANLIGYLGMSAVGGALATRFGPRIVISVGMLVTGLGMVLTGLAAVPLTARCGAWRPVSAAAPSTYPPWAWCPPGSIARDAAWP